MTQPAQAIDHDQLQALERSVFDAIGSIGVALGHNIILGVTLQSAPDPDNNRHVPCLTLIFHGAQAEDPPRQLLLSVPQNGLNVLQLLAAAAEICAGAVNEYQEKTGRAAAYFQERQEIAKVRRNGKSRIIQPSRS